MIKNGQKSCFSIHKVVHSMNLETQLKMEYHNGETCNVQNIEILIIIVVIIKVVTDG